MFKVNTSTIGPLEIRFKHNRKNGKAIKGNETKSVKYPQSTICFIKSADSGIGTGVARPIGEIPVVMDGKVAEQKFGRRLKKVYKLDDGTCIAILKGDNFKYSTGRKTALEKAMENAGIQDKTLRRHIWTAYFNHCKPTASGGGSVDIVESQLAGK